MDWNSVVVQLIAAATPVLTMVILWALKLAWNKIPAAWVIFATPVLGIALNFALSWLGGYTAASPVVAALLGTLAIVIREFLSTLSAKGATGGVTITKGML